ncbi:MAG: hypothetical protein AAGH76_17395 [Pseudomonadota bacterium]
MRQSIDHPAPLNDCPNRARAVGVLLAMAEETPEKLVIYSTTEERYLPRAYIIWRGGNEKRNELRIDVESRLFSAV